METDNAPAISFALRRAEHIRFIGLRRPRAGSSFGFAGDKALVDFERHELGRFNNALGSGRLRSVKLSDSFQSERQVSDLSTTTFANEVKAHRVASRRQVAERANKAVDHKPQMIDGPGSTKQSTATKKFFVKKSKLFKRTSAPGHS